jgi:hypothetical protein
LEYAPQCHHWLRQLGFGTGDKLDFLALEMFMGAVAILGGSVLIPGWAYFTGRLTKWAIRQCQAARGFPAVTPPNTASPS